MRSIRAKRPLLYMYTISSLKKKEFVTPKEIKKIRFSFFNPMNTHIITKAQELGPVYRQLHEHGVICTHTPHKTKRFYIHKGFKIQMSTLIDIDSAWQYIHKNMFQCHKQINQFAGSSAWCS